MRTKIGAVLLALIATGQTIAYLVSAGPVPADGIGPILKAYRSVADFLPPDGLVGFIGTSKDDDFNGINYYLAQQALTPRVLSWKNAADASIVITTTGAPPNVSSIPALQSFALIGTGEGEIRILRNRNR